MQDETKKKYAKSSVASISFLIAVKYAKCLFLMELELYKRTHALKKFPQNQKPSGYCILSTRYSGIRSMCKEYMTFCGSLNTFNHINNYTMNAILSNPFPNISGIRQKGAQSISSPA